MSRRYSYWVNAGKYAMLQKLTSILLGLLAFMILARNFIPEEFGVWGLFIIITSIFETCRNALVRNGYILFINSRPDDLHPAVDAAALTTNILFTLLLLVVCIFFGGYLEQLFNSPGLMQMLRYYSIGLVLLVAYSYCENFLYSKTDFRAIFWMYFLRNSFFLLTVLGFYLSGYKLSLESAVLFYAASLVPGLLAGYFFYRQYGLISFRHSPVMLKEFLHYGKYVLGNNFFSLVFVSTDSFMTARYVSTVALSYYNTGARILNFADIPSQVLGDMMFPKAAQIVKNGTNEDLRKIYGKTVAAALTFILPVILMVLLFSEEIIILLVGGKYLPGTGILRMVIFYALFLPFIKQFGNIMDARGRPHVNFWLMFSFSVYNILSNLFFISHFGMRGAAMGTLSSYLLLFIITQVILNRVLGARVTDVFSYVVQLYPEYFRMLRQFFKPQKS